METVEEYAQANPEYAFNFDAPMRSQRRVYDLDALDHVPTELRPTQAYSSGGRGRPNRNQTRTHSQCASCHRVLRNDFFYLPPSIQRQNIVYTHCKECAAKENQARYGRTADLLHERRLAVWQMIAPRCALCGFDRHPSAMDMHHLGDAEELISKLVAQFASSPSPGNARKLAAEVARCIPLCSNCHRLLHADIIELDVSPSTSAVTADDLLRAVRGVPGPARNWQPDLFERPES